MTEKQFDRDMEIWLSKQESQEKLGEIALRYLARKYVAMLYEQGYRSD